MQMTKVVIWCRHEADNLIGIGDDIPWHIPSDSRFFADVIAGQDVVFGRKTYETVPPEVLSDCAVWVLSKNQNYEPRNPDTERLVGDVRAFKEFEGDLYIGGEEVEQRHQLLEGHPGRPDQGHRTPQPAAYQVAVADDAQAGDLRFQILTQQHALTAVCRGRKLR